MFRMLTLSLFCLVVGCEPPVAPATVGLQAIVAAQDTAPLVYVCDNRFRLKNNALTTEELEWEVEGTSRRGVVTLPPLTAGVASTTRIVTGVRGAVRLVRGGQLLARAENRSISCLSIAPSVTPKAVWDSVSAPENVLNNPPGVTGKVLRHTLYVRFKDNATLAQKEQALAAVNAEVIGGMILGSGQWYHIRLTSPRPSPPDSVSGPLLRAYRYLKRLPQVQAAILDRMDRIPSTYLKPTDGTGFRSWALSADSAAGDNWRLDAVEAPLGWSCETGDSQLQIGVADRGFHDIMDLQNNVGTVERFAASTDPAPEHATAVAAVIAAEGNNQQGVTGVMWRARLNVYDADKVDTTLPNPTWYPIAAIARAGAANPIVNVSMGKFWLESHGRLPDSTNATDVDAVNDIRDALMSGIGNDFNTLYCDVPLIACAIRETLLRMDSAVAVQANGAADRL